MAASALRSSDWSSDVCSSDLGMAGFEGPFWIEWDSGYVAASLAIGVALSSLAFFVLPRAGTLQGRVLVFTLFTLAICGLHFTGMTADRKRVVSGRSVSVRLNLGGCRIFKKKKHKIVTN